MRRDSFSWKEKDLPGKRYVREQSCNTGKLMANGLSASQLAQDAQRVVGCVRLAVPTQGVWGLS